MLGQEACDESSKNKHQSYGDTRLEKTSPPRRQKMVRFTHGGGASVDVVIWRNKHISGAVLASAAIVWLLFQRIGYSSITFICHFLMLSLLALFCWSNYSFFVNKTTFAFPVIVLQEDLCTRIALTLTHTCNQAISIFREVALGKDTRKFLSVVLVLWLVSIVDFFTLTYMLSVIIMVMPLLHEKVLQRLSKVPFIENKQQEQQQQEEQDQQQQQEQQQQQPQQQQQ